MKPFRNEIEEILQCAMRPAKWCLKRKKKPPAFVKINAFIDDRRVVIIINNIIIFIILRCAHGRKGCRCRSEGALSAQCSLAAAGGGTTTNGRRADTKTKRHAAYPYSVPSNPEQLFALRPCGIRRPFRLDARGSVVRVWTARGVCLVPHTHARATYRPASPFRHTANVLLTYPMPPSPEFRPPPKTPRGNKSRSPGPHRNRKTLLCSFDVQ